MTGSLAGPRLVPGLALLSDGRVPVAGGTAGDMDYVAEAEIYDPATGEFSDTGDMIVPRSSHSAAPLLDGQVLLLGGFAVEEVLPTASAELFVPALSDAIFANGFDGS
ncbi:MAG TPA: kelch repeat-containing protein [Rhodanobacteraceae bacterium]|nr:kelch repeat-containing protein [Rhodanobacteraceae bacterium]